MASSADPLPQMSLEVFIVVILALKQCAEALPGTFLWSSRQSERVVYTGRAAFAWDPD